jgi:hypothetical protein
MLLLLVVATVKYIFWAPGDASANMLEPAHKS